jgi:hypothetical protein
MLNIFGGKKKVAGRKTTPAIRNGLKSSTQAIAATNLTIDFIEISNPIDESSVFHLERMGVKLTPTLNDRGDAQIRNETRLLNLESAKQPKF